MPVTSLSAPVGALGEPLPEVFVVGLSPLVDCSLGLLPWQPAIKNAIKERIK